MTDTHNLPKSEDISWDSAGLVPAVVQHANTRQVLMMGYMNKQALELTLETKQIHFWSRSREELWRKGETSGNTLELVDIFADCDLDCLLVTALPAGPTCHRETWTCFSDRGSEEVGTARLERLWVVISERDRERPIGSYTTKLLNEEPELPARKLVEESTETLLALFAHKQEQADDLRVAEEAADVIYHLLVALAGRKVDLSLVLAELDRRAGK